MSNWVVDMCWMSENRMPPYTHANSVPANMRSQTDAPTSRPTTTCSKNSRASIGNPSRESRASLRRWDDGDDESDEQAGHEPPSQRPLHCQLHRQWANGCLYQEGSVAFYEGRCLDDPY